MKINMPTVNSNVKLITSNQAPTTSNLAKGEMAFGQVGGVNSIYGNTGNGIIKIEFTASGEPIIYFANEKALNTFVEGDDVPESGWYAAIADTVYEQYGEWVAFKLEDLYTATSTQTFKMTKIAGSSNGDSFYGLANDVDFGPDGTGSEIQFGNYAHTRYLLYLDYSTDSTTNWTADFNFEHNSNYSVNVRNMNEIGDNHQGHLEVTMDNYTSNPQVAEEDNKNMHITTSSPGRVNLSGYLVVKEILSDGEPWINWDEIIALDSGEEPEPTTTYVQVSLSATLSNGINSVKLSDYKETGTLASPQMIGLADDYTLRMDGIANRNTKFTIDASIPFFGYPDHNFPSLQLNIYPSGYGSAGVVESNTEEVVEPRVQSSPNTWVINPVYEQGSKIVRWQGQTEKNLYELLGATTRDAYGRPLELYINVMQYQEGDAPNLTGTLKIEDA